MDNKKTQPNAARGGKRLQDAETENKATAAVMERKRAEVIFPSLNIMLLNAKTVQDILAAKEYVLKEAQTAYPESTRAEMIQALEKQFENPEKMLENIRKKRR